ncbi:beta-ketoacyl synthase N-terminal-like domain-containing protein [Streptomyces sp. CA-181903]|uniref:beta-ketoacyl synthase N-terminal-like domain-containing protein n=1 Tax=Streptomyces sp. CA-181903 TaxID=3240055 RepID=UPI003D8B338F
MSTVPAEAAAVTPLSVTAVGAVTPAGLGLGAFSRALIAHEQGHADPTEIGEETLPPRPAQIVPGLADAVHTHIGRKGNRHLDRTTRLGLLACHLALKGLPGPVTPRTGVVLGTSTGSIRSSSEYSMETLRLERPYLVNPSLFPNTVMNCAAGQIAIRHGFKGVNATLAGGHLAGVQTLRYARNALRQGHADRLLAGGVEEFCSQSAWGWHRSGALEIDAAVGEGSAVLMVEPETTVRASGRHGLARILACETAFAGRRGLADALTVVIATALERSGKRADEVHAVSLGATGQTGLERIEQRAVTAALGGRVPQRVIRVKDTVGECFSAGGPLQMAGLLGVWQEQGAAPHETAIVTAVSREGQLGCVVVEADSLGG